MRAGLIGIASLSLSTFACLAQGQVPSIDWSRHGIGTASPLTAVGKAKIYTAPLTNPDYLKTIQVYNGFSTTALNDKQTEQLSKIVADGQLGFALDLTPDKDSPSKQYAIVSCLDYKAPPKPSEPLKFDFTKLSKYKPALDLVCDKQPTNPQETAAAFGTLTNGGMFVQPSWVGQTPETSAMLNYFKSNGQLISTDK
jgi:hypothetical protein